MTKCISDEITWRDVEATDENGTYNKVMVTSAKDLVRYMVMNVKHVLQGLLPHPSIAGGLGLQ